MNQTYSTLALILLHFFAFGQRPFFHVSPTELDASITNYHGDSLIASVNNAFSDARTFINYNPVIPFDGVADYLEIDTTISDLSQITIYTVFRPENNAIDDAEVWGIHNVDSSLSLSTKSVHSGLSHSDYTGLEANKAVLHTVVQHYSSELPYPNEKAFISLGLRKKELKNSYFKGSIAEFIGYKKRLRGVERQKLESGLGIKYGITLGGGENYITSNKKIIWDAEKDTLYSNNIAGIGRDDKLDIYQKQATSANANEFLVFAVTAKAASNAANTSELKNRTFLVWGDNDLDLQLDDTADVEKPVLLARKWLLKATGTKANEIVTQLQIDASSFFKGTSTKDFMLVVDRSGSGNFDPADIEYIEADERTADGVFIFNNLLWDVDKSGADNFSFTFKRDLTAELYAENTLLCPNTLTQLSYRVEGGIPPFTYTLEGDDGFLKKWTSQEDSDLNHQIPSIPKGTYTLTVVDRFGTTSAAKTILSEDLSLQVDLGEYRILSSEDNQLVLEPKVSNPEKVVRYTWTKANDDFTSSNVALNVTETGLYTLTVVTTSGCVYTDSVNIAPSFVTEFEPYPNPALNGDYQINIALVGRADVQVRLFNALGVQLAHYDLKNTRKTTLLGKKIQQTGVYYYVLYTPHEVVTKKLIVK